MLHAEACIAWNAAMCLCALPLGGRLAGLPAPGSAPLLLSGGLGGLCGFAAVAAPALAPLGLCALPLGVRLCYRRSGARAWLRCCLTTLAATLLLGGGTAAGMSSGLRPMAAAALSLLVGLMTYLFATLAPAAQCDVRQVELGVDGRAVLLPAMLDSGNLLRDPVTGQPVLVAPGKAVAVLFPGVKDLGSLRELPLGFRLLSVRTAAGNALLPMFKPDVCRLYVNGHPTDAALWVAVAGSEYRGVQALVPTAALPRAT